MNVSKLEKTSYSYNGIRIHGINPIKQGDKEIFIEDMLDKRIKEVKTWYSERTITNAKLGLRIDNSSYEDIKDFFNSRLAFHKVRKVDFTYSLTLNSETIEHDTYDLNTRTSVVFYKSAMEKKLLNKPIHEVIKFLFSRIGKFRVIDSITEMVLINSSNYEVVNLNCGNTDCKLSISWTNSKEFIDCFLDFFDKQRGYTVKPYLCYEYSEPETEYRSSQIRTGKIKNNWVCSF